MNRWLKQLCWCAVVWVGLLLYSLWQDNSWSLSLLLATLCAPLAMLFSWFHDWMVGRAQERGLRMRRRLRGGRG
ncbi:MAG TPA: hypothetical protein VFH94_02520 [Streptomyces sp.]|nr:hypothetical protein [Streptomyces sp.]